MLAYDPGLPVAFAPWPTLASLGLMMLAAGLASACSSPARPGFALLGGAIIGLGIGGMHYLGMAALRLPGRLGFDSPLVVASLLAGMALGAAALAVAARPGRPARAAAAGLLAAAVLALHLTGMAAVTVLPDAGIAAPATGLDRDWLAVMVGGSTAAMLLAGAAVVAVRARLRAADSQAAAARLRDLAEASFEGIAILTPDLRIADCNRRLTEMLGQPPRACRSAPCWSATPPRAPATLEALVAEARQRTVTALLATAHGPAAGRAARRPAGNRSGAAPGAGAARPARDGCRPRRGSSTWRTMMR